ncbi:hypothetical protein [Rubrivirga sp.]|uniref:hypothetical protein n=1 Tax=Rubrivirga sp. TaxID=1885344 RepID=UPI003B5158F2
MTVDPLSTHVRWLTVYAVGSTLALGALLLTGARSERATRFVEIDVERINVRKPDGRLSLVVSNEARMPGVIVGDREVGEPKGRSGLVFYDGEGAEMGGLTYGSRRSGETVSHSGHLAFDGRGRDQALDLSYSEEWEGDTRTHHAGALRLIDRNGPAGTERYDMMERRRSDDPAERAEAEAWLSENGRYGEDWSNRVVVGSIDGRAYLGLNDPQARERLRATVGADGTPRVEMLDADGAVVREVALDG